MEKIIQGLHHITAIASDPQRNLDFYAGILGLRFVKKTVNFDAPDVYHLYYGNAQGSPGTIMTFFPFPEIAKGRKGKGQLTTTSFSIPENGIGYWMTRLKKFHVPFAGPDHRFDESVIYFEDHDGLGLELVANDKDKRDGFTYGTIPSEFAIKGFYGMTLNGGMRRENCRSPDWTNGPWADRRKRESLSVFDNWKSGIVCGYPLQP